MTLPLVSVVVAAYDYGALIERTLESALGQDYPQDRLEVVVVDDGSKDDTPDVVAAVARRHPGRVRYLRQENTGYVGATNRGLAAARGDLVAILDADDLWPPEKTRRQVDALLARPEVGLVYTDMEIVDVAGAVLHESFWAYARQTPVCGARRLGALLGPQGNPVVASSILVRASLLRAFAPIPDRVPYVDWWIATRIAAVSQLAYVEGLRTGYRQHDANLTLGTTGARNVREQLKMAEFRRDVLASEAASLVDPDELLAAWHAIDRDVRRAMQEAGTPFVSLRPATAADRAEAAGQAAQRAQADDRGDVAAAVVHAVRAAALDPFDLEARAAVGALEERLRNPPPPVPAPLVDARGFITLAFAQELLARPELLAAYAAEFGAADDATLAIYAPDMTPEEAADRLGALVRDVCPDARDTPDLLALAVPPDPATEAELVGGAHALLTARPTMLDLPAFGADGVVSLRGLAGAALVAAA